VDSRISINSGVCHGKPVIRGTRVLVANILANLAAGETADEIIRDYPDISHDDIRAALAFGSELAAFETRDYEDALP